MLGIVIHGHGALLQHSAVAVIAVRPVVSLLQHSDTPLLRSSTKIAFFHLFVVHQVLRGVVQHDAARFEHVPAVGNVERHVRVLLDQWQ